MKAREEIQEQPAVMIMDWALERYDPAGGSGNIRDGRFGYVNRFKQGPAEHAERRRIESWLNFASCMMCFTLASNPAVTEPRTMIIFHGSGRGRISPRGATPSPDNSQGIATAFIGARRAATSHPAGPACRALR